MLWPADEPWPMCTIPHKRSGGYRYTEVVGQRELLEQVWRRDPRSGPTAAEIEIIDGFKRGKHAPHLRVRNGSHPLLTVDQREWDPGTTSWIPYEDQRDCRVSGASVPPDVSPVRGPLIIAVCPRDPDHSLGLVTQ